MKLIFILGLAVIVIGAMPVIGFVPEQLAGMNYNYLIMSLGALIAVIAWMIPGGESIRESIKKKI